MKKRVEIEKIHTQISTTIANDGIVCLYESLPFGSYIGQL